MKLGGCTYPWVWKTPLEEAAENLSKLGYKFIELAMLPPHIPDAWLLGDGNTEFRSVRKLFDKHNLRIASIHPNFFGINVSSFNPRIREESIRYIEKSISAAEILGAHYVTFSLGARHALCPEPLDSVWPRAVDAVERLLEKCRKHERVLCIETLPGNYMGTAEACIKMVEEIPSDILRINYDPANTVVGGEDPAEGLKKSAPYLAHIHLSDCRPTRWRHAPIGEGTIDFAAIARTLREIDYRDFSILEIIDSDKPYEDNVAGIKKLEELGWTIGNI